MIQRAARSEQLNTTLGVLISAKRPAAARVLFRIPPSRNRQPYCCLFLQRLAGVSGEAGQQQMCQNSLTRDTPQQSTRFDTRFRTHEISAEKRRRGAFETVLV